MEKEQIVQSAATASNLPVWITHKNQGALRERLLSNRSSWLVTGAAGFIGSNLVERC